MAKLARGADINTTSVEKMALLAFLSVEDGTVNSLKYSLNANPGQPINIELHIDFTPPVYALD